MTLESVLKAVTLTPAKAVDMDKQIGVLDVDKETDVTVLKMIDQENMVEDAVGNKRTLKKAIMPIMVWRNGVKYEIAGTKSMVKI